MATKTYRIGLCGLGVVGQGVWKHLTANRRALEARLGVKFELARAAVRDPSKKRPGLRIAPAKLTTDPLDIARDPSIDIVCELMGGTGLAKEVTEEALRRGKVVVTANKALICKHGESLFALMRESRGLYFFEASVAGGIPVIKALREGLVANRFPLIYGILNGTCNYILTRMEREGLTFEATVADARRLGYVEADESLDLDGWDTAHKAAILAFLAHGKWVSLDEMTVEGIRGVTLDDIRYAAELGYRVKLLAVITRDFEGGHLGVRVHPALVPLDNLMAHVMEVYNAASVTGDVVGTTLLTGRGAGQDATASAVISDIADALVARNGGPPPVISEEDEAFYQKLAAGIRIARPDEISSKYYLRLTVDDRPGVLADVAKITAKHGVSIATVLQRENAPAPAQKKQAGKAKGSPGTASLILTTHTATEKALAATLADLAKLPAVQHPPFLLRIFQ